MSLLSVFGILFETDAKEATSEVDKLDKGLVKAESTANSAANSFESLNSTTDSVAGGLSGLSGSLSGVDAGFIDASMSADGAGSSISSVSNIADGFTSTVGEMSSAIGESISVMDGSTISIGEIAAAAGDAISDVFNLGSELSGISSVDDIDISVTPSVVDTDLSGVEGFNIDAGVDLDTSSVASQFSSIDVDSDAFNLFSDSVSNANDDLSGFSNSLGDVENEISGIDSTSDAAADSIDDLTDSANSSSKGFAGLADNLGLAAAGLIAVTGIAAGITSQALATDEIGKFSETLGLNIEDVGAWGEAAKRSGGDAASFRGSLQGLNSQLTDINLTGGGEASEIFARLGVNAIGAGGKVKSAFEVLPELADSFQNLSKAEAVGFGEKLGLDQGTILLLQQGRVAVEQLVGRQKQLGVATKEDYLAAAQFNDAFEDTKQVFANLFTTAGTTVLPMLTTMLEGFQSVVGWVKQNKTLVTGFFVGVAGVITAVYLPAIASAAAATLIAASPFIAIGLAVAAVGAAFAILYEDVVAYLGGQESFIGDLAKKYEWFGKVVDSVISGVKFALKTFSDFAGEMFDNVKLAAEFLGPILTKIFGGVSDSFGSLGVDMGSVVDLIIAAFSMLGDAISKTLSFIASPIETTKEAINDIKSLLPDVGEELEGAFSGVKSFFGLGDNEINENINKMIDVNAAIDSNPLNGQTSASIVNSQQSISRTNNINVGSTTVNTQATDANEVANRVSGTFNDQMKMAVGQLTDAEDY